MTPDALRRQPPSGGLSQDAVVARALREMNRAVRELERCIVDVFNGGGEFTHVAACLEHFDAIQADAQVAGAVLGMLSLFNPAVAFEPPGAVAPKAVKDFAIKLTDILPDGGDGNVLGPDGYRFPQIEKAAKWLTERGVVPASEFGTLQAKTQQTVFTMPGINSRTTLERVRGLLAEAVRTGQSLPDFRKDVRKFVNVERRAEETTYRTNIKRAYVDGLETSLHSKAVADKFPFIVYNATDDFRVRDHHWDLDGFVAEKGTKLYRVMMAFLKDYRCRCGVTPIDSDEAERRGIKTWADVSDDVRTFARKMGIY